MSAAVDGYNRGQGGEEPPPEMTGADYDEMIKRNADWIMQNRNRVTH